jgi:hypothetical protein
MTRKPFTLLVLGLLAASLLSAQLNLTGKITLDSGQEVAFNRLTRNSYDPGGLLDKAYVQAIAGKPNLPYGASLKENWQPHHERLPKLVFEDIVRIDFLPLSEQDLAFIKAAGKACIDTHACADRRATLTFRNHSRKENLFIYLGGETPRYAMTPDNRTYDLWDYDITTLVINRH